MLDQFHKGSPLSLTLQVDSVQQGETTNLYPSGGTPPYTFGLVEGSLYCPGSLGSIADQDYTAGTAIGTVLIHLIDAAGTSVDSVVTIIPPTPTAFSVQANPAPTNDIDLGWSYGDQLLISGFQVQRSTDGVTFTNLVSEPSSATTYTDTGLNQNHMYYYRIYAVAGPYQSLPTTVLGAQP